MCAYRRKSCLYLKRILEIFWVKSCPGGTHPAFNFATEISLQPHQLIYDFFASGTTCTLKCCAYKDLILIYILWVKQMWAEKSSISQMDSISNDQWHNKGEVACTASKIMGRGTQVKRHSHCGSSGYFKDVCIGTGVSADNYSFAFEELNWWFLFRIW